MRLNDILNGGAEGVTRFDCKSTIKIIHSLIIIMRIYRFVRLNNVLISVRYNIRRSLHYIALHTQHKCVQYRRKKNDKEIIIIILYYNV